MEMDQQDGTEFVFSYTVDVNKNRQESCKIHALQTLDIPSQTQCVHLAKLNCTEMLDSGPQCPGTRLTPEEMVINGFPEGDTGIELRMGPKGDPTAGPGANPGSSEPIKTVVGPWNLSNGIVLSGEEAGTGASLTGCSTPNEGEAGLVEFQACLTSGCINESGGGENLDRVNTKTTRSDRGETASIGTTTGANRDRTGLGTAAHFETCVNGSDGLGGTCVDLIESAGTTCTDGSLVLLESNGEVMGTDTTTSSNWVTFGLNGQTAGTGTSREISEVARELSIGRTNPGTRSTHANLIASVEIGLKGTSTGLVHRNLEALSTGNADAAPIVGGALPQDHILERGSDTMKPDSDVQEHPKLCARNKIPNGDVTRDATGEQAGHLRYNAVLDKGVRVGNCGLLVISKRPVCDDCPSFGEPVHPWAPSEGCDRRLGVARPQSLRTTPGHVGSLSCDSTPLDEDRFMADPDMDEVLDSVVSLDLSRRQSAPDKLQERDDHEDQMVTKKHGIADFLTRSLFSWKPREPKATPKASGWRIFGKLSPKENLNKDSTVLQQEIKKAPQPMRRRNLEFEPLSTTALILEDRPANLPAKSEEEAQRHRQEYNEMVAGARRREMKDAQRKKRQMKERYRQEESIARALVTWNNEILPNWESMRNTWRVRELWWHGLPPSIRGKIWSLAIGNELNITPELYEIFLSRAKEKWRSFNETSSLSENEDCGADKESSLDLIKLDIFRTFPSLYIFQKGGPYHDVLHSVLGAYTCYRPDVGYVQGMSFIAAVLILNLEEADAFIAFANLLNKPCQMAFFRVDHDLMLKYFAAFEVFFEENLPKLFQHFQSNSLTPDFYLIDWIFTLYSKPLPLDVACRVWDLFCRDGEEALFRTALGILRLHQDVLLQMDFIHIAQFLSRLPQDTPAQALFGCIANTHMLSNNRRWNQVFSALIKDGPKDADKTGSPALRS